MGLSFTSRMANNFSSTRLRMVSFSLMVIQGLLSGLSMSIFFYLDSIKFSEKIYSLLKKNNCYIIDSISIDFQNFMIEVVRSRQAL